MTDARELGEVIILITGKLCYAFEEYFILIRKLLATTKIVWNKFFSNWVSVNPTSQDVLRRLPFSGYLLIPLTEYLRLRTTTIMGCRFRIVLNLLGTNLRRLL